MAFLKIQDSNIYYTTEDFARSIKGHKELYLPEYNWCLPACVTTLIYYWQEITEYTFPIPKNKNVTFWINIWAEIIPKERIRKYAGFSSISYDKIKDILKKIKIDAILEFHRIIDVHELLETAKEFVEYTVPIPVIIEVLAEKFYNYRLKGAHHAIIILGFEKPNFFQIYDPAKPEVTQYWTVKNKELLEECLAMPHHIAFLIPKEINQIPTIHYKQMRVDKW